MKGVKQRFRLTGSGALRILRAPMPCLVCGVNQGQSE